MKPLIPALLAALSLALLPLAPAQARPRAPKGADHELTEDQEAVRALRKEIAAEELLVALDLDAGQKTALATLVREGLQEREAHRAARAKKAPRVRALLEDYLEELRGGGAPSADTVAALKKMKEEGKADRADNKGRRGEVKEALQQILSDEQRKALAKFQPMSAVRPAEDDPARVERRERRTERVREFAEREDIDPADMRAIAQKKKRQHARKRVMKTVRGLLFSEAFLAALER